ncbi:DUF5763 domain-containing protein [Epilithonimonas xixisoli]|uniref:Uncharacterized protein n=1 Tax=Epilithonimonas xixisoli TaxID=1476462 RepID=A0A4R8I7H9_9FLAO|nr:DUF5763 domain-containing protein [Epilithonimonas xixisoli]TDX85942.1 hypothetical protein B0I22_0034 [Epilithonimonas xixisoli]
MKSISILFFLFSFVFANSQTVYYTPSGQKYHTENCRMVKNVSNKTDLNSVLERGLSACKICQPVSTLGISSSGKKKTQGTEATVQCKGTTKSGTRCKHKTSIGNGYCFQHQP